MSAEPVAKRVRLDHDPDAEDGTNASSSSTDAPSEASEVSSGEGDESGQETGLTDEEEAIRTANTAKHGHKTKSAAKFIASPEAIPTLHTERRRALSPEAFGSRLQDLLSAPAPTARELSRLHTPARKALTEEAIERKALRLVQASKHASRERGHVTDIISGWPARPAVAFKDWPALPLEELEASGGAEAEKTLRRLAQKGVVKLFNAIRAAQTSADTPGTSMASNASVASKKRKVITASTVEPHDPSVRTARGAPDTSEKAAKESTATSLSKGPNLLGTRGKETALANLSRDSFLSILKSGGTNKSAVASTA